MDENFRLIVDGTPRSPTKAPSELVEKNSAKDGLVAFTIPLTAQSIQLQVGEPAYGVRKIPIELRTAR